MWRQERSNLRQMTRTKQIKLSGLEVFEYVHKSLVIKGPVIVNVYLFQDTTVEY